MNRDLGKLSLFLPDLRDAMPQEVVLAGGTYVATGDLDEPLVVETSSVELNGRLYTKKPDEVQP